jgi:hypothetical protein
VVGGAVVAAGTVVVTRGAARVVIPGLPVLNTI